MVVPGLVEQVYWTVGIDCGEQKHRFVMLGQRAERQKSMWVKNRADEIQEALARLMIMLPKGVKIRVVTEGLRSLGGIVVQVATPLGVAIWQVNPKALDHYRDLEGQPRKDDDRDAFLLAKMCINGMEGCRLAVDAQPDERVLCRLTRLHTRLTEEKTVAMNRFRSRLLELSPEVVGKDWEGPAYNGKGMRAVLGRWPAFEGLEKARVGTVERLLRSSTRYGSRCTAMAKVLKEMAGRVVLCHREREIVRMELGLLIQQTQTVEGSLSDVDKRIQVEVTRHPVARKLLEMPGVGPYTAGVDVGELLPLARNVSEGKVATYAGTTPLSRRSASKDGPSKLARGVNKHAARANYLSAVASRGVSAIDNAYYEKQYQLHQGHAKAHVKAHIALARQRLKVKYKLMTTDAVYDKETLIASHLERQRSTRARQDQADAA